VPNAKITSKGQVTIPAAVRDALGLEQGDTLAFEVKVDYVIVRKRPGIGEVAERHRHLFEGVKPRYATIQEAVAAYSANAEPDEHSPDPLLVQPRRLRRDRD
jgi:AbrB family looped-hinge helix DNA binding protein